MSNTLAVFADQVTSVAREVGVEGKLGGQAHVPGAAGIWRDLTANVNRLAANLTTQVRAIAEVATAVTKGDLTRSVTVEVQGEVAALKDNINEMIRNLKDTTGRNKEQDWLKTNLAKFTQMMQGQRDLLTVSQLILSELAPLVEAHSGIFYIADTEEDKVVLELLATWACDKQSTPEKFELGNGLIGQCAMEKKRIILTDIPADYIRVTSGLGKAAPLNVVVLPVLFEGNIKAVIELGSFHRFSNVHIAFLDQLTESIGIVLNTIAANMRTEELLKQSQALAEELQQTNQALKEKAEQLALTSKYKSQFLANMSHELRTPVA
jgi:HAMP domain-containing protein